MDNLEGEGAIADGICTGTSSKSFREGHPKLQRDGQILGRRFVLGEEIGRGAWHHLKAGNSEPTRLVAVKSSPAIFFERRRRWSMFQPRRGDRTQDRPSVLLKFVPLAADKRRSTWDGSRARPTYAGAARGEASADGVRGPRDCEPRLRRHRLPDTAQESSTTPSAANIIDGPDGRIRLIDFGLAHAAVDGRFRGRRRRRSLLRNSVAPEQIQTPRGTTTSVDNLRGGRSTLRELTGQSPLSGRRFPFAVTERPASLAPRRSFSQAESRPSRRRPGDHLVPWRRNPAERYASAAAMQEDLGHLERVALTGICTKLKAVTPGDGACHGR